MTAVAQLDRRLQRPLDRYEIEVRITLVDGSTRSEKLSVAAAGEGMLRQLAAQMLQSIATSGCLKYEPATNTFSVDPTPSQIVRLEATLPKVIVASAVKPISN